MQKQRGITSPSLRYVIAALVLMSLMVADVKAQGTAPTASSSNVSSASTLSNTTAVSCSTQQGANFTDVPSIEYSCSAIKNLNNEGAVQGFTQQQCQAAGAVYPCFLPYNFVTRAQFSKILVLAFAWPLITPGTPHFTDVPSTYFAYAFIETAFSHQIISGFDQATCQAAGAAYPCFLPNTTIERGQMIKMTTLAAGFTDNIANRQSFGDVDSNNFAYLFVERGVSHNVVGEFPPLQIPSAGANCSRGIPPCFYPFANVYRADAAYHIDTAQQRVTGVVLDQVFGPTEDSSYYSGLGAYTGVSALVTTNDPPVVSGQYAASPIGLTARYNPYFIEAGFEKQCTLGCSVHPYMTWFNGSMGRSVWRDDLGITIGAAYTYKSFYKSDATLTSQVCAGTTCIDIDNIDTPNSMGSSLPFVVGAGESTGGFDFGTVYIYQAKHQLSGDSYWYSHCYDTRVNPWRTGNSSIFGCPQNGDSWAARHTAYP